MRVTDNDNTFSFAFDEADFQQPWRRFLDELKRTIPPAGREYDSDTGVWTIFNVHKEDFEELRRRFFVDPAQLSLFGGES